MASATATSSALLVLGIYLTLVSLLSYLFKERLYISQAVIALLVGIIVGPIGFDVFDPLEWVQGDVKARDALTYEITRIVLGVQVLFTGINLPHAYLLRHWRSLSIILLPLMTAMWLASSLIIYLVIPRLSWLESLIVGACITPTDPVLAASVVRGRFAEQHVPSHIRDLLAAESGANDGLAFPFIALALRLCQKERKGWSNGEVIQIWVSNGILYECFLSILIGILLGFIARRLLKKAHILKLVDHESFLAYNLGLTFFVLGLVGIIGSDDLLACFIAGNSFTFDGFFKDETEDQSFQDVIDNILDSSVFIYIGTLIPWREWKDSTLDISIPRLLLFVILILLLRRLPALCILAGFIPDLRTVREVLFVGWLGPMGVGAVYYVQTALGDIDESHAYLRQAVYAVVLSSVVAHGFSIPVALLGNRLSGGGGLHRKTDERTPLLLDINGDPASGQQRDLEGRSSVSDVAGDDRSSVYAEGGNIVVERDGHVTS